MFCTKCGSQIADGAKFCPICGNVIETEEASQLSSLPAQPLYQEPVNAQPVYEQTQFQQQVEQPAYGETQFGQQQYEQPAYREAAYQEPQAVYQHPLMSDFSEAPAYIELTAEDDEAVEFSPTQRKLLIRAMAVICYLGPYFLFPAFALKDKKWLRHHVNNGCVCTIFSTGFAIFSMIPFVGWLLGPVGLIFMTVLIVKGIIRSIKGQMYHMPMFFGKMKIIK